MGQAEGRMQQAFLWGAMKSFNEREKETTFLNIHHHHHPGGKNSWGVMIQPQVQLCQNGKQKCMRKLRFRQHREQMPLVSP